MKHICFFVLAACMATLIGCAGQGGKSGLAAKSTSVPWLASGPTLKEQGGQAEPLAFIHVTVIDATGAPAQPNRTVMIQEGRITAIGRAGRIRIPKHAQVVDATGKFLIPGLWDMHAHVIGRKEYLQLFTANGVTGIRHMHGNMFGTANILQWRRETNSDSMVIPRMVIGSTIVDGPKPFWPGSISVTSEIQARQVVAKIKDEGWDFVKVYDGIPRDAYFAIVDEAKKSGLPVAGHVPSEINVAEASDAGQKSIEHLDLGILLACSIRESELRQERALATNFSGVITVAKKALETYSDSKAAALFACFARNGIWLCPTLTLHRVHTSFDKKDFFNDPRMRFMPPDMLKGWCEDITHMESEMTANDYESIRSSYRNCLMEMVEAIRGAGIGILAGTDTPNPCIIPGFSLHDELQLLVEAGLTPMEALQTATRNPVKFLGTLDSIGTIEKGKIADLVLLDANPLEDIRNTQKIRAVVASGRLLDRETLDEMLAQIEAMVNKK